MFKESSSDCDESIKPSAYVLGAPNATATTQTVYHGIVDNSILRKREYYEKRIL